MSSKMKGKVDDKEGVVVLDPVLDKHSVNYMVRSGIAGGLAGCVAKTLIAPLDRVKILFQTGNPVYKQFSGRRLAFLNASKHILSSEGLIGLFRGHSATLLRVYPYAAIKFVAYEQIRSYVIPTRDKETHIRRFMAGSLSGVASVFCTYPLDVIRVRLAYNSSTTEPAKGRLIRIIRSIWREPSKFPLSNYYRGFTATVLGMIPYAGVSFLVHDSCHDVFRSPLLRDVAVDYSYEPNPTGRRPLKVWAQLSAGALSGLLAQTASYPLEVVRRRMQVGGVSGERLRIIPTFLRVVRERGIRGLFVGLSIGYMKVMPMFATSFFVYERAKLLVGI